jgi:hypothetical protein
MLQPMHFVEKRAAPYASAADFLRTFDEEMHRLYLFSFLLTADHDRVGQANTDALAEEIPQS